MSDSVTPPAESKPRSRRGFACMSPEKQRAISSKGGKKCHAIGKGHQWTTEEARAAGEKGGRISRQRRLAEEAKQRETAEKRQPWLPNVGKDSK